MGAPSIPAPVAAPPPPMLASTLNQANANKQLSGANDGPYGAAGTILTGPMGLGNSSVTTAGKTLTGQ